MEQMEGRRSKEDIGPKILVGKQYFSNPNNVENITNNFMNTE